MRGNTEQVLDKLIEVLKDKGVIDDLDLTIIYGD